ncbi:MAG TPA: iron-sulfur cluster assembly accessory protein [Polyangiaceae bacterium]|nr:iron-sulfur cluster assembly accessory protein [Polyangiaceae bacterium]
MTASKIALDGTSVIVTESAEKFMRRMTRFGGGGAGAGFRLVVSPGGCSGLSADFSVEQDARPGDETLIVNGFRIFVPAASVKLLAGVTIDFVDTPMQQGLTFFNPRAPASCSDRAKPAVVQLSEFVRR